MPGLNPYCVGLWSLRNENYGPNIRAILVLILIVLDYGH